jgi:Holliday junction DNA helicase RuvA
MLVQVHDQTALVENGGVFYEVLLPSALADRLRRNGSVNTEMSFETIYYIEAGDRKSNHFPRLVGFTDPIDREFFSLFTQVPGLGIKKALKSLIMPIREIATAIESKDAAQLGRLPGVGSRLADKIIAELNGKTAKFALSRTEEPLAAGEKKRTPLSEEAIEVLTQLQYSRGEAEDMIQAAIRANPGISTVEQLITEIFRNERKSKEKVG